MIWRIATAVFALAAFILAALLIDRLREPPPPPPDAIRFTFSAPPATEPGSGDEPLDAAISYDETQMAFVATRDGVQQLWRRALEDERAEPLTGTEGARFPAWKPTGRVISFFAAGTLKQITLQDGVIHDLAEASSPAGATWLRDGSLLFAPGPPGPIRRLLGGQIDAATKLAPGDITHVHPAVVDGTSDFVYVAVRDDGRRIVRLASAGLERELTTTSGHAQLVGNDLLYVRDGVLLAYQRDLETGALAPHGVPLGVEVGVSASGRGSFTASRQILIYAPPAPQSQELAWFDLTGTRAEAIGDAGDYWQVRLSPDDAFAAVTTRDPLLRALDIVLFPAARPGDPRRITTALAAETDPVWSPDGRRVLFRSMEGGMPNLFARAAHDKDAANEPILRSDLDETPTDWRAGEILFHARGKGGFDVMALQAGTANIAAVADSPFNETDARWSPDGRWTAYVSDESGRSDVYVRRPDGMRLRVSFAGGTRPRWSRDGRTIFFIRGSQVMRADRAAADPSRFEPARVAFAAPGIRDFDLAHRSDRLVALLPAKAGERRDASVVLNWSTLVERP